MEKKQNKGKFIFIAALVGILVIGIGVCLYRKAEQESSKKEVFRIGDKTVYLDEVNYYLLQSVTELGLTADELEQLTQEDADTQEHYKSEVLQVIVKDKVEAAVAGQQGITLTEEEETAIAKDAVAYMGTVNGSALRNLGITKECIATVYTEKYLAQLLEKSVTDEIEVEQDNFCTMYQMFFPKVEMTEDGDYARQDDGVTPILLPDEQIAKAGEDAEAAHKALEAGEEPDEVAKRYGVDVYSGEAGNLSGSFEEPFLEYARSLKEGECSPVIDMSSCYVILKMMQENDEETAEQILGYYRLDLEQEAIEEKRTQWYQEMGVGEEPDFIGNTWKKLSLYDFVKYVEE